MRYLGDVHLGKKFEANVPLHRRGDREKIQWAQFVAELDNGTDPLVQVGDIFDKTVVSNSVVWATAQALREAAQRRPIAILRGNHDASRDSTRVSSFQILTELVRPFGVIVADEVPVEFHDVVLIPWSPWLSAAEMVDKHAQVICDYQTVVGHWDVVMGDGNQLPSAMLASLGVTTAITGHDHNARELEMDGVKVIVTGSMQPYSHGEDAAGAMYETRASEDAAETLEAEPNWFADKCLRVIGDWPYEVPNCLQFQVARAVEVTDDEGVAQVEFEAFDLRSLFEQACEQTGLSALKDTVFQKLEDERGSSA